MNSASPAYGLWGVVLLNSAVFIIFAFSFFKPQTARDWRTFGAFAAFVVALFVEMYGFPLTIYLLSGWLQTRYPGLDLLSHDARHLWATLLGDKGFGGDPHSGALHLLSYTFLGGGFWLLSSAWNVLYHATRARGGSGDAIPLRRGLRSLCRANAEVLPPLAPAVARRLAHPSTHLDRRFA